jgi:hypothetical protein
VIAVLLLALVPAVTQGGRENRLHLATVELVGPLEEARFDLGAMGETRVVGPLAEGERRTVQVPLPAWGDPRGAEPDVEVDGAGQARFVEWDAGGNAELARRWLAVPAGLRARPLPLPPAVDRRRPPEGAVLVVVAVFLVGLALRRRPGLGHALGLVGAAGVLFIALPGERAPSAVAVHEGDGDRWVTVVVDRGSLWALLEDGALRFEVSPPRAALTWTVELSSKYGFWKGSARGAVVFLVRAWDPEGAFHEARNEVMGLEEAWVREAGSPGWVAHPPWPRGHGLQSPIGPADPPGWLNPALPMGTGVLIGRAEPQFLSTEHHWIRLTGFSPP